jgi:pseudo-rSAM protein
LNTPVLGNINTISLLELIAKELEQNTAWRKIRNNKPCNECLFQYLCPSISNYEMTLERENLCTHYEKG